MMAVEEDSTTEPAVEEMKVEEPSAISLQKEDELRRSLQEIGVDWVTAQSFPYGRVVEQYINGKGTYPLHTT